MASLSSKISDETLKKLREAVGGHISVDETILRDHGRDAGLNSTRPMPPDLVIYPGSEEEVSRCLSILNESRNPVIPFGFGSSLEGHVAAIFPGSVSINLSRMSQVLEVHPSDGSITVQSGISRAAVNDYLTANGIELFFSVDPGQPKATIGGMVATRCSGTNTVRYGTIRENVLAMKVVLASGKIARLGKRVKKSAAGYDLSHLMIGSEGTLGVVTEVTLRLHPIPKAAYAATCCFPSVRDATECVVEVLKGGIPIAKVEILDAAAIRAVNAYSSTAFEELPTLFFEFHSMSEAKVRDQSEQVREIAFRNHSGSHWKGAADKEERDKLWLARHTSYWASLQQRYSSSGSIRGMPTDVVVPISKLPEAIAKGQEIVARAGLFATLVGHVGDGNFHLILVLDSSDESEMKKASMVNKELVDMALNFGGTCTGEHGIGIGKLEHLDQEWGQEGLWMMGKIKTALDPNGILNPGKLGSGDLFNQL